MDTTTPEFGEFDNDFHVRGGTPGDEDRGDRMDTESYVDEEDDDRDRPQMPPPARPASSVVLSGASGGRRSNVISGASGGSRGSGAMPKLSAVRSQVRHQEKSRADAPRVSGRYLTANDFVTASDSAFVTGSGLYVCNIHPQLSQGELISLFERYGTVKECRLKHPNPHLPVRRSRVRSARQPPPGFRLEDRDKRDTTRIYAFITMGSPAEVSIPYPLPK
jgi:hypothetical protein